MSRGIRVITLDSDDSNASEMAGSKSVPRSTKRIVIAPIGSGIAARMYIIIAAISATLLVSVYAINFFRLSYISRPVNIGRQHTTFLTHNNLTGYWKITKKMI